MEVADTFRAPVELMGFRGLELDGIYSSPVNGRDPERFQDEQGGCWSGGRGGISGDGLDMPNVSGLARHGTAHGMALRTAWSALRGPRCAQRGRGAWGMSGAG